MAGARWEEQEIEALKWLVTKREQHREALAQSGERERPGEKKWTWAHIADKMQRVSERDGWKTKRKYDGNTICLAWQSLKARDTMLKPESKDVALKEGGQSVEIKHGTGDTVDAFPTEQTVSVDASPAHAIPLSKAPSNILVNDLSSNLQLRMDLKLAGTVQYHYDPVSKSLTLIPKSPAPATERFSMSDPPIKVEQEAGQIFDQFLLDEKAQVYSLTFDPTTLVASLSTMGQQSVSEEQTTSGSSASVSEGENPPRLNARWEDNEIEALEWFMKKREEDLGVATHHGRATVYTWEAIAAKMNKVAPRDGWDIGRVYTAGNCYGAWNTKSSRVSDSRPSKSRRLKIAHMARSSPIGAAVGKSIPDTINDHPPPPPGPDPARGPAPYHWLPAERQALHDVYVFSRISENKHLSRGECRRLGKWTWSMVAREMNRRSEGASWSVGRIYDQSCCYNMIKYELTNFNLKGDVQPLPGLEKDEDDDEDRFLGN